MMRDPGKKMSCSGELLAKVHSSTDPRGRTRGNRGGLEVNVTKPEKTSGASRQCTANEERRSHSVDFRNPGLKKLSGRGRRGN